VNNYHHDYRVLGVPPDCSLNALKAARRRLTRTWHPDRFPAGSEQRRQAEERIKDVNTAFARLRGYYAKHGMLPAPSAGVAARTPPVAVDPKPTTTDAETASPHPAPVTSAIHAGAKPILDRKSTSFAVHGLVVLAALFVTIETVQLLLKQDESRPTHRPEKSPAAPPGITDGAAPHRLSSPRPGRNKYFTVGSTLGEVYAVQGVPASIENGVWHYGKSSVYFADGLVTSWEEDPDSPLKTSLLSRPPPRTAVTYTIGSTKAEVRAAEGSPLVETTALWDYGLSKVHFRDDRVTGWESSPMRPLKARK
jgi:hypothetical protein